MNVPQKAPGINRMPGAVLEFPGGRYVVTEVGTRPHSQGYGPVDFLAWQEKGACSPGDILNTPWGYCEVVKAPVLRRISR